MTSAENSVGRASKFDFSFHPSCSFTSPYRCWFTPQETLCRQSSVAEPASWGAQPVILRINHWITFQKSQRIFWKLDTEQRNWASESYANHQMNPSNLHLHQPGSSFRVMSVERKRTWYTGPTTTTSAGSSPHVKAALFLSPADLGLSPCLCRDLTPVGQIHSKSWVIRLQHNFLLATYPARTPRTVVISTSSSGAWLLSGRKEGREKRADQEMTAPRGQQYPCLKSREELTKLLK